LQANAWDTTAQKHVQILQQVSIILRSDCLYAHLGPFSCANLLKRVFLRMSSVKSCPNLGLYHKAPNPLLQLPQHIPPLRRQVRPRINTQLSLHTLARLLNPFSHLQYNNPLPLLRIHLTACRPIINLKLNRSILYLLYRA
jgi:hypothetical protein